jgi:phosphoribosylaminoimidazole-succinocarboxamide synthase
VTTDADAMKRAVQRALAAQPVLRSLPLVARGKVRDVYAVGDNRLLMVASDRLSAFDVVMQDPVPGKGALLTKTALAWFARLAAVWPNHLTGEAPEGVVEPAERPLVEGRAMLVQRLDPLPVEAVVRAHVAGSGWKEYVRQGTVCGIALPPGLEPTTPLPEPIFTPATKAAVGDHDENVSFEAIEQRLGAARAAEVREASLALFRAAAAHARTRGLVLADTKFEFGLDGAGRLVLMDEVLTPDSSRFWLASELAAGRIVALDKQPLRDFIAGTGAEGAAQAGLRLPPHVIEGVRERYERAYSMLFG